MIKYNGRISIFRRVIFFFLVLLLFLLSFSVLHAQNDFYKQLSDSAVGLTKQKVVYDPAYTKIDYPMGDVASDRGVCTDVIIRAYRMLGTDLQREVHEDMRANFKKYPQLWGSKSTDRNIDHRRVPNLMTFFSRHGSELPITSEKNDYSPGDIVCWRLGNGMTHIGIVTDKKSVSTGRPMIVHNIGGGQNLEDCLFDFKIIGHYRYMKR